MKSDEYRDRLFRDIENFVPNQVHREILKGLALFYAYQSRIEGFDKAAGVVEDYTPLAHQECAK